MRGFWAVLLMTLVAISLAARRIQPDSSLLLVAGRFHPVAHKGSGTASVLRSPDGNLVLRLTDLKTTLRPDLVVCLSEAPDAFDNDTVAAANPVVVAALARNGESAYPLPSGTDLTRLRSVTIWSAKYRVNFTTAPLRAP